MINRPSPRLVLVVSEFPKLSETFIVNKFLGLLERGWDVHLVCNRSQPKDWEMFPDLTKYPRIRQHVHITWPTRPKLLVAILFIPALIRGVLCAPKTTVRYITRGFKRFGWQVFKRFYLDLVLICQRPDIVHFEFASLAVNRTHLKHLLHCHLSASFRGYDINHVGLDDPIYYAALWRDGDAFHFLGEALRQRALQRGCPAEKPHRFIPPAVDLREYQEQHRQFVSPIGTAERPVHILSVGRLEWKKGYEFALQSIKGLKDQGIFCEYRIVGAGEFRDALYFARHQLGLEMEVNFLGAQPHHQVLEQLAWADLFLHAAVSEGFCNAVIEAQALAVPVVCSGAGGLPENVADGVTGFVVPRREPQRMTDKLACLIGDGGLRQAMGNAGRLRVERLFSMENQLAAWDEFFKKML